MGRLPPTHIDDPAAVGRRVREAREAAGLSLRSISFPGCSPSFLSRVESGDRVPGAAVIVELARRLGVDPDQLTGLPAGRAIPEWRLSAMEMAARLRDDSAAKQANAVLSEARELDHRHAIGRALETLGHLALAERRDDQAAGLLEEARSEDPAITPANARRCSRRWAGRTPAPAISGMRSRSCRRRLTRRGRRPLTCR